MSDHPGYEECAAIKPLDPDQSRWRQLNITFADTDSTTVERSTITHLGPVLAEAETRGLITSWFFIRKQPWKLRYLPSDYDSNEHVNRLLHDSATALTEDVGSARWCRGIYEPETHAFGGDEGMRAAHDLFHADSRHIFIRLAPAPERISASISETSGGSCRSCFASP